VKFEDRALDIAVVGLGQGGGNLAAQFSRMGYRAIALNTALTDLSALGDGSGRAVLPPENRLYVGIDGYDGAGGDLNYGRECIRENAEKIRRAVSEHAEDADVVLITAGLGGGTGSSASELVKTLEDLALPLVVMATLPTEHESGMAKVNAVRGASALVKTRGIGWIFVDNSQLAKVHAAVTMDRYFETINSVIVGPLDALNKINHDSDLRPIRTLDGEDLRRLLLAGGVINYASDQLDSLEVKAIVGAVHTALASSSLMPAGYALEQVSTIGVVLEASETTLAHMPFAVLEELSEQLKEATNGAAVYLGVYRSRAQSSGVRLRLICSSYQLPDGILAMVNDARREGGILRDKLQQTLSPLELGEIEEFDLFRTSLRTGAAQKGARRQSIVPGLSDEGFDMPTNVRAPRRSSVSARPVAASAPPAPTEEPSPTHAESDFDDDDEMVDARPTPIPGSSKRDLG
jgi:cell division GTPase FtsZ